MNDPIHRLSKSRDLRGLQGPISLSLHRHPPCGAPPLSERKRWLLASGHMVGTLARTRFDGGHLIDEASAAAHRAMETWRLGII